MSALSPLVVVIGAGTVLASLAAIWKTLLRPLVRLIRLLIELAERWKPVPADIADIKSTLSAFAATTNARLSVVEHELGIPTSSITSAAELPQPRSVAL